MLENPCFISWSNTYIGNGFFSHWCWNSLRFPTHTMFWFLQNHVIFLFPESQTSWSTFHSLCFLSSTLESQYAASPSVTTNDFLHWAGSLVAPFSRMPPAPAELQNRFSIPEFLCPLYSIDSHSHHFYSGDYCPLLFVCVLGAQAYECYRWASTRECRWKPEVTVRSKACVCSVLTEFLRQDLSLKLELSVPLGWLSSELPWVPHPPPEGTNAGCHTHFLFHDSARAKTRSSCLHQHLFTGS